MSSSDAATENLWVAGLRLPDEINPVLLRETQSLYKGRAFPIFLILSLCSMVLASGIFLFEFSPRGSSGLDFLKVTLWFLTPIVLILIPLQAGHSMSEELSEGSGSILLMSGLSPGRIIAGKIQLGLLQMGVALGLFSPLIGLSYLLRGTDALLILGIIVVSFFANLLATTLAVALSAQTAVLKKPVITAILIVFGLGMLTLSFLVQLDWILIYAPIWVAEILTPAGITILIVSYLAILVLGWLIATSALTHPNENRASAFRIYHSVFLVLAIALILALAPATEWGMGLISWSVAGAMFSIPFFITASTDAPRLSPRVRAHIPHRSAWLATLFLPGCGRGLIYALTWSVILLATGLLASLSVRYPPQHFAPLLLGILLYVLLYASLGSFVRARLPHHISRNWITRLLILFTLGLLCFIPLLIQAPFGRMDWNPMHLGNPFFTIAHTSSRGGEGALILVAIGLVFLILANKKLLVGSWIEVRDLVAYKKGRQ